MAVSDLTNTTWVINASVSQLSNNYHNYNYINYHINNFTPTFKGITKFFYSNITVEVAFRISASTSSLSSLYCFYTSKAMTNVNASIDSAGWYKRVSGTTISNLVLEKMTDPLMITITSGTKTTDADLIAWLEANATQIVEPTGNAYNLTHTLTNLTKGNITLQITPDTGYTYPTSLTITNGTLISYDNTTGIAVISGDDTTEISCECIEEAPDNAILDCNGNVIKASDGYLLTTEFQSGGLNE